MRDGQEFQRGRFLVEHWEKAVEIAEMVKQFEEFPVWRERGFIIALYRINEAKKVDIKEILEKCKKYPDMLKKQAGFKEYIFNLESIYNKGRQIRVVIY